MSTENDPLYEAKKTLTEWEEARQKTQEILRQFMVSGSLGPGGKIPMPERILDSQGRLEIEDAERIEKEKWEAHQEAIAKLRRLA